MPMPSNNLSQDLLQQLHRMQTAQRIAGVDDAKLRMDRLRRVIAMLDQYAEYFCDAANQDFGGRARETTLMSDLLATVGSVGFAHKHVKQWMAADGRKGVFPFNLFGARVSVRHDPKGVVGILGTWNVPLFTTLAPLASVLAAGNRAMLKPSEMTPRTSELLASAVTEFFDSDEISVFNGGMDMATAFSQLPFDHLVFTGSGRTGRLVMKAAAENLVPVTLEMGGKSPVLVGRSADLQMAAHRIVLGKTLNAGQICVTPDTVYVPEESLEAFVQECVNQYQAMFPHGQHDEGWTSIINGRHAQRIEGYLNELHSRGARLIPCIPGQRNGDARKMALWLAVNPPADSMLAREEIFGPVLEVQTYRAMSEAVEQINAGDSPLALYYFGTDKSEEQFVLDHTRSGGVTVNDVMLHVAAHDAPFGGVGASGMGCYHGYEGFLQFSHARTVYRSGWWDPRRAFGLIPPYGSQTYANLRKTLRP